MTIKLIDIFIFSIHLLVIFLLYTALCYVFRYIIKPNYRWHQKGNICYEDQMFFAYIWTILIGVFGEFLYFGVIKIIV